MKSVVVSTAMYYPIRKKLVDQKNSKKEKIYTAKNKIQILGLAIKLHDTNLESKLSSNKKSFKTISFEFKVKLWFSRTNFVPRLTETDSNTRSSVMYCPSLRYVNMVSILAIVDVNHPLSTELVDHFSFQPVPMVLYKWGNYWNQLKPPSKQF